MIIIGGNHYLDDGYFCSACEGTGWIWTSGLNPKPATEENNKVLEGNVNYWKCECHNCGTYNRSYKDPSSNGTIPVERWKVDGCAKYAKEHGWWDEFSEITSSWIPEFGAIEEGYQKVIIYLAKKHKIS